MTNLDLKSPDGRPTTFAPRHTGVRAFKPSRLAGQSGRSFSGGTARYLKEVNVLIELIGAVHKVKRVTRDDVARHKGREGTEGRAMVDQASGSTAPTGSMRPYIAKNERNGGRKLTPFPPNDKKNIYIH